MKHLTTVLTACLPALLGLAGCAAPRSEAAFYEGFGNYTRRISTASPEAQRWFDQGMQLLYGYNHDEAIRSFERAAELDPACAIAHWGIAYANGFHINNTEMTPEQSRAAFEAAQAALAALAAPGDGATPAERALVEAVAERYAWPEPEDRGHLDLAYADAMGAAWRAHPEDADIGALYAESLMDLQPWDLWTKDGQPKGRTEEIVEALETTLRMRPDHPGANHFYIHTVEASPDPARAVAAADRLVDLVPGAGHLVHMPSHIYTRVGRYADAADANARAIAVDEAYFALAPEPDFYSLYYIHNVHFLAYAAMMEGRYAAAMSAARKLEADVPADFLRAYVAFADGLMATPLHVMIRFGRWDKILTEPEPPGFRLLSRAQWHYARGVAYSALGRTDQARGELAAFEALAAEVPEDWKVGNNASGDVLSLCRGMLRGELLFREGKRDEAFALLRDAAREEDALVYDEPPGWMQPVRHALGALLMSCERYAEAEEVYAEDLDRNAENGWSLLGMELSLRAQGAPEDAAAYAARRAAAWRRADVQPASSCYCEPGAQAVAGVR
ncbi:MAG: hypothetical protein AAF682_16440 [Planctomycetota bacterium]